MKIKQKYNGTIIGGLVTVGSLLLTLTFLVPILSVIPGVIIETIMSILVDNEPYSNVGKATILTLVIILILSILVILFCARKTVFKNEDIIGIMIIEYFIIHSLGLYVYWATSLNFRSDGQLVFSAVTSFPASSFGFVALGFFIDLIKINPFEMERSEEK